jgi:hypothetical protein
MPDKEIEVFSCLRCGGRFSKGYKAKPEDKFIVKGARLYVKVKIARCRVCNSPHWDRLAKRTPKHIKRVKHFTWKT